MPFTPTEAPNFPIILKECQAQGLTLPNFKEDIAYILATARHETASWQTLEEYRNRDGSIPAYWNNYGGGAKYHGRGYVQLTHIGNYQKFQDLTGKPLVDNPDLAMDPELAAFITVYGMKNGSFSNTGLNNGSKLQDFAYNYSEGEPEVIDKIAKIGDRAINFIPARQIVNGNDQAMLINNYAREYVIRINNGEFDQFFLPPIPPIPEVPKPTIIEFPKVIREPKRKLENIDYQNAWDKKDITWFVDSLIDRDDKVEKLKKNIEDLNSQNLIEIGKLNKTIGERELKITELETANYNLKNPPKNESDFTTPSKISSQDLEKLQTDQNVKEVSNLAQNENMEANFNLIENLTAKPFWKSKKFIATFLSVGIGMISVYFKLDINTIILFISPILGYLGLQGLTDFQTASATQEYFKSLQKK